MPKREFLTEEMASEYLGMSHAKLKRIRLKGEGPEYVRLTPRMIRYEKEALDAFIETRSFKSSIW